jgi:hypothetical protein
LYRKAAIKTFTWYWMTSAAWVGYGPRPMQKRLTLKLSSPTCSPAIQQSGRVVAFNTAERWSEDVSEDVAEEIRRRCDLRMRELPASISDFVERHESHDRQQLTLRLV